MVHLQTYRNTFTGPQAVAWLTSSVGGGAGCCEEAVDMGGQLMRAGAVLTGGGRPRSVWSLQPSLGGCCSWSLMQPTLCVCVVRAEQSSG
jgi:hypothetical protein